MILPTLVFPAESLPLNASIAALVSMFSRYFSPTQYMRQWQEQNPGPWDEKASVLPPCYRRQPNDVLKF